MAIERNSTDDYIDVVFKRPGLTRAFKYVASRTNKQHTDAIAFRFNEISERRDFLKQNEFDAHSIKYLPLYEKWLDIVKYGKEHPESVKF